MPAGGVAGIDALQRGSGSWQDAPSVSAPNAGPWDDMLEDDDSSSQDDDGASAAAVPVTSRQWPVPSEHRRLVRDDFGAPLWLPPTAVGEPSGYKVLVSDIPGDWDLNKAADS